MLRARGVETAVIGAVAAAVHGYPRATADVDLASSVDHRVLEPLKAELAALGYGARFNEPDAEDPLGVLTVHGKEKLDVVELLSRNPDADMVSIRALCRRFGLETALDALLRPE